MAEDYEKMTVAELKVLLKEAGLPISGKKADLIERLSASEEVEETIEEVEDSSDDGWEDDYEDDDDDYVYVTKQKPVLSDDLKEALAIRAAQKRRLHLSEELNGSDTRD